VLRARVLVFLCGGVLAALLLVPATVQASGGTRGGNCVSMLARGQAVPVRQACFDSFASAIRFATGGRVTNAPATAAAAVADPAFVAELGASKSTSGSGVQPQQAVVIAVDFVDQNFGGASHTSVGLDGPCTTPTSDIDYQEPNVGLHWTAPPGQISTFWNDRITSFQAAGNCFSDHFVDQNFLGDHTTWRNTTANIGPEFNDKTTSIRWS